MSAKRVENSPATQALKRDAGALVKAVGGVEAAEQYSRAGFRRLSEYGRPDNDCHMPLDVIDDLEAVAHGTAGWPQVTQALCRRRGGVFVPIPPMPGDMGRDVQAAVARHCREASEATTRAFEALGDGVICADDAEQLLPEFAQAVEAAVAAYALLQRLAGGAA